jgi:hypothetical protein
MKFAGYTKQERTFITLMRILMVVFFGAACVFAAIPDVLLNYLNDIGKVFLHWQSPPHAAGGLFWLVLAVALLIVLSYACLLTQKSPVRNGGYARIVILSKFVTAAGFAAMLRIDSMQFYYLVGAVVDGLIFIITWRIYAKASISRS